MLISFLISFPLHLQNRIQIQVCSLLQTISLVTLVSNFGSIFLLSLILLVPAIQLVNAESSLIRECTFQNNTARKASIYCDNSDLTIRDCYFSNSTVETLVLTSNSTFSFSNLNIQNNKMRKAIMMIEVSTGTIQDSLIYNSNQQATGLEIVYSNCIMTNITSQYNTAPFGASLFVANSDVSVSHSTFR